MPTFSFFWFGLGLGYIIVCDVTLVCVQLYRAGENTGVVRACVIQPPVMYYKSKIILRQSIILS